jgi:hypothetical protein
LPGKGGGGLGRREVFRAGGHGDSGRQSKNYEGRSKTKFRVGREGRHPALARRERHLPQAFASSAAKTSLDSRVEAGNIRSES